MAMNASVDFTPVRSSDDLKAGLEKAPK